ncbi:MAG: YlmH/Sll1252 family protein [Clostridiaceae bacterium]
MNKKSFQAMFQGEDPSEIARLWEIIEAAFSGRPVVSNEFYTPGIWSVLSQQTGALPAGAGFYDLLDCDRRLFASPVDLATDKIRILEVTNSYPARQLTHRDYLGALMNLGVRREKFADLFLKDEQCYIPMVAEIFDYVLENLVKVANNGVVLREANWTELSQISRQFQELMVLVPSLRLDAVVAELTNKSRSQSEELVKSGQVLINYLETKNRSEAVKTGDILTIRGFGKFRLAELSGETKKGRIRLRVEKYV